MAEYIPLKMTMTDHDSTTKDPVNINKSTTIDEPTTITIDGKNPKPINSNGGQRPLSPSPPPRPRLSKEEEGILGCIIVMAMLVVCFVKIHIDNKEVSEYVPTADPIIQLQAATFSIHNLSSSTITTKGEVSFIVTKPSDCTVAFYDTMVVSLFHMEKPLSIANMESFFQNESNHTMVKAIFPPTTAPLEKSESERMARDFNSSLSFEFSFDVNAKGRVWQNNWKTEDDMAEDHQMNIWCRDVKVKIMAKTRLGMMAGEPAKCKMQTFYE